ncbi:MAG: hypothetical protein ABI823_08865 [Bryobacteraceae bacterium]
MHRLGIKFAVVLAGVMCALAQTGNSDEVPRFEDYPAKVIYKGPLAQPVLATREQRLFRTRIRNGVSAGEGVSRPGAQMEHPGPNFAGRYIIVNIGCGSPCVLMPIVDAQTGRIHNPPGANSLMLPSYGGEPWLPCVEFRVDSNLMIMRPSQGMAESPIYDRYFLWQADRWKLLRQILRKPESPQDPAKCR